MQKSLLDRVDSLFHPNYRFNIEHLEKNITGYSMLSSTFVRTKAGRSKPVRLTAVIAAALFLAGTLPPRWANHCGKELRPFFRSEFLQSN